MYVLYYSCSDTSTKKKNTVGDMEFNEALSVFCDRLYQLRSYV